jgi:assimilatory nitrate reductase catalytic subunit
MTRTGLSPRLGQHLPEPYVEIHPDDAQRFGIDDGGFARIETDYGYCVLKAVVTDRQQPGMLFAPIHWSGETSSSARVGALVAPVTDPFSGQPESKATPAHIEPWLFTHRGFVLSQAPILLPHDVWWSRVAVTGGYGYLLAANSDCGAWQDWWRATTNETDAAEYEDRSRQTFRAAAYADDRLRTCLFMAPAQDAISWDAVKVAFAAGELTAEDRRTLLSGRSRNGVIDSGPIVCACFGVGRNTICNAIASGERNVMGIGARLRAGTNCGSCIPELRRLIAEVGAATREPMAAH